MTRFDDNENDILTCEAQKEDMKKVQKKCAFVVS